jgi:hypothetical protein
MDYLILNNFGYVENKKDHREFKNRDIYDTLNPLWNELYEKYIDINENKDEQLNINRSLCYSLLIITKEMNEMKQKYENIINELKNDINKMKN